MVKVHAHTLGTGEEPAPSFPSDAEIKLAEQLRHQLEERYLGPSAPSPARQPSDKPH
jgi:hypothetical protein